MVHLERLFKRASKSSGEASSRVQPRDVGCPLRASLAERRLNRMALVLLSSCFSNSEDEGRMFDKEEDDHLEKTLHARRAMELGQDNNADKKAKCVLSSMKDATKIGLAFVKTLWISTTRSMTTVISSWAKLLPDIP